MRALTLSLALIVIALIVITPTLSGAAPAFKVLIFRNVNETIPAHAASVPAGVTAIVQLGTENNFQVDQTTDPQAFTAANLAQYKAIIFLSPEAQNLNASQQTAFENYIKGGGGFVGIHGAMYMEKDTGWSWYRDLIGAYPAEGDPPKPANNATVRVIDTNHPSTAPLSGLPNLEWLRKDEWYNFVKPFNSNLNVLLNVDEDTYNANPNKMGNPHPIAWYQNFQGGRSWYTGGGHYADNWNNEPLFRQHVLGGILWAAGQPSQATPTVTTTTTTVTPTATVTTTPIPNLPVKRFLPLLVKE